MMTDGKELGLALQPATKRSPTPAVPVAGCVPGGAPLLAWYEKHPRSLPPTVIILAPVWFRLRGCANRGLLFMIPKPRGGFQAWEKGSVVKSAVRFADQATSITSRVKAGKRIRPTNAATAAKCSSWLISSRRLIDYRPCHEKRLTALKTFCNLGHMDSIKSNHHPIFPVRRLPLIGSWPTGFFSLPHTQKASSFTPHVFKLKRCKIGRAHV